MERSGNWFVTLFGKGGFADVINSFEMKSSWITRVCSKFTDTCHSKRKAEGGLRQMEEEGEIRVIEPQARVFLKPPEAARGSEQNLP